MLSYLRVFINRDRIVISCALRVAWLKASAEEAADDSFQLCITLGALAPANAASASLFCYLPFSFSSLPSFFSLFIFPSVLSIYSFPGSTEICIKSIHLIAVLPKSLQN